MIALRNIEKSYGKKEVLKGISMEIKKEEFVALIGKNGAGKTTLIDIICKLKKQDKGEVQYPFNEKNIYEHLGVQTQNSEFDERFKVKEIYQLWKDIYGKKCGDSTELIDFLGLTEIMNQKIKTLSGGQKQKLSILIGLMHNPEFLILDELTTGLDAFSRAEVQKYLKKLSTEKNKTILMVSHYMEEVEALCDKVFVLKDGQIFDSGSPDELKNKYNCNSLQQFAEEYLA